MALKMVPVLGASLRGHGSRKLNTYRTKAAL